MVLLRGLSSLFSFTNKLHNRIQYLCMVATDERTQLFFIILCCSCEKFVEYFRKKSRLMNKSGEVYYEIALIMMTPANYYAIMCVVVVSCFLY